MYKQSQYINKLTIMETGTYSPMYRRPFVLEITDRQLDIIADRTQGGTMINHATIGKVAGQIIRPASHTEGQVNIANGFDTRRFMFMMEVVQTMMGTETTYMINGWTDYLGISRITGKPTLDENMVFTVNSVMAVRTTNAQTGFSGLVVPSLVECAHILKPDASLGIASIRHNSLEGQMTLRPEDVLSRIEQQELSEGFDVPVRSSYNMFNSGVKGSRRTNTLPTDYLTRTLKEMREAAQEGEAMHATNDRINEMARSRIAEPGIANNDVFYNFKKYTDFTRTASFTLGDIQDMQSDIKIDFIEQHGSFVNRAHSHYNTDGWGGNDFTTIAASSLLHSVPAVMLGLFVTSVNFSATNMTPDNRVDFLLNDVRSNAVYVDERFVEDFAIMFEKQMIDGPLNDISEGGLRPYELHMHVDIYNEVSIELGLDGNPPEPFQHAQFCDSLYTPMITTNSILYDNMAIDMAKIIETTVPSYNTQIGKTNAARRLI